MKTLIVNAIAANGNVTGLGVYARKCLSALVHFDNAKFIGFDDACDIRAPKGIFIGAGLFGAFKRFIYLNFVLKFDGDSLVYSPTHHGFLMAPYQVITIHDLIPLEFPYQNKFQYIYFKFFIPLLIRKCIAIFTVSESTKILINRYYGVSLDRIFVVPNSIDVVSRDAIKIKCDSDSYLLVVGAGYPHKNIHELINFHHLWSDKYRLKIVSARGAYFLYLMNLISSYGIKDRVDFLGYVTDDELASLYKNAVALVYPSKSEGFGIPPLEALSYSTPVIVSDIPIFREIYSSAVLFVDLGVVEAWEKVLSNLNDFHIEQDVFAKEIFEKYSKSNFEKILIDKISYLLTKKDFSYVF